MKFKKLKFFTFAILLLSFIVPISANADVTYGDVDCDNEPAKITDVILLSKHIQRKLVLPYDSQYYKNANCHFLGDDGDALNVNDLKTIIDVLLGTVDSLPVGEPPADVTITTTDISTTMTEPPETSATSVSTTETTTPSVTTTTTSTTSETTTTTTLTTTTTTSSTTTTSATTDTTTSATTTVTTTFTTSATTTTTSVTTTSTTSATTTTTVSTTTGTTTSEPPPTTTTTVPDFEPQVPIYQYIYGQWFESSLDIIEERAGFNLNQDMTIPVKFMDLGENSALAQCSTSDFYSYTKPARSFEVRLGTYWMSFTTPVIDPDGTFENIGSELPFDMIFAHELTHGMSFISIPYTTLMGIPNWYAEGLAEATVGNNRMKDFEPGRYSFVYSGKTPKTFYFSDRWEIAQYMISDFSNTTEDINSYYAGYLFLNYLDNYGTYSGEYYSRNGGRIKEVNSKLEDGNSFVDAFYYTFKKYPKDLIEEFKAEAAAITSYEEWYEFADTKMNIQCDDGLNDALCNIDAAITDIIPNIGGAKPISESNIISYNGHKITLQWNF